MEQERNPTWELESAHTQLIWYTTAVEMVCGAYPAKEQHNNNSRP